MALPNASGTLLGMTPGRNLNWHLNFDEHSKHLWDIVWLMFQTSNREMGKMVSIVLLRQALDCIAFGRLQRRRGVLEIFLQSGFVGITPERAGTTIEGTFILLVDG